MAQIKYINKLNVAEIKSQNELLKSLNVIKGKSRRPIILATVGIVGSGKSFVAKELSKHIGGNIVSGDRIRFFLRKYGGRYRATQAIAENIALKIIEKDGNVILDSDFIDVEKRRLLIKKTKNTKIIVKFIWVYCDFNKIVERIISRNRGKHELMIQAAEKIHELWRRTPHHYYWAENSGGRWMSKKLSFISFAEINTVDLQWRISVKKCAQKLLNLK